MTKAVVFDFGDTLVDYPLRDSEGQRAYVVGFIEEMVAAGVVALDRFESTRSFADQLNTENPDNKTRPFVERLRSEQFFGDRLSIADAEQLERAICDGVFREARLLPDAQPTLFDLRQRQLKTGIVSNLPWGTSSTIWANEFSRHGFGPQLIDKVVCCVDAGFRKPHPAAIIECLRQLDCDPKDSIYVGDRPSDVDAGKAAGCRTALVRRRGDSFTESADIVIHDLRELLHFV